MEESIITANVCINILKRRGKIMERVLTELHDVYVTPALGKKSCLISLASIKNVRGMTNNELFLRLI